MGGFASSLSSHHVFLHKRSQKYPIAELIPLDEEAKDLKALVKKLEAAKAKNDKIEKRKKEREEAKCQKEAKEEKE